MNTILGVLAAAVAVFWFGMVWLHERGLRRVPRLPVVREPLEEEPLVSVILAAKDEEEAIGRTLETLAGQSYRNLEIIVVNDRSEDGTGEAAERFSRSDSRVKVLHVERLPEGWLGKNHAMYTGYLEAKGSLLLFTDADVRFRPEAIRSAVAYLMRHRADHLSLIPYFETPTFWLKGFVHFFGATLYLNRWPWKPNDDRRTEGGIGIGAFLLLTREAYERIGTHRELKLRPDDDLQLGIRVKQSWLRQRYLIGTDHLRVEWYPDLPAAMRGLEKNVFAGLNYSLSMLLYVWIAMFLFHLYPFAGIWLTESWARAAHAAAILFLLALYGLYTWKIHRNAPYDLILFPVFAVLYLYVMTRSCVLVLRRGGVCWRGTFYRLDELKELR